MNTNIRKETVNDYAMSEFVVEKAFENISHCLNKEKYLVEKLRKSEEFIPELSLVAEVDGKIVGHILYTKLYIIDGKKEYTSLALVPLSVLPEYQNKGIGSKLVEESFKIAIELGYKSVIILEHEDFYKKFGFTPASKWNIKTPFEVPDEVFLAKELVKDGLKGVSGTVVYAKEFFENI